jgi:hypothetical protein
LKGTSLLFRIDFPISSDKHLEFNEKSPLSCSKSFRDQEIPYVFSKRLEILEESKKELKKYASEQASIDIKDVQERDPNYLKEFITKLKNASEGIPKNIKTQLASNAHKKTNSLTSAPAKRRDLTGYYVTQKKTKDQVSFNRNTHGGAFKGNINVVDMSEARPSLAASRSHASSLIKTIEKSFKQNSIALAAQKDTSLTASYLEDVGVGDLAKIRKDKEKKALPQGLLTCSKTSQDYKKAFGGLAKKKNSESCSSVKLAESRLTPQLRPSPLEAIEKSNSDH